MASASAEDSRAIEALQEALRNLQQQQQQNKEELGARAEVRSLEFWRAIIAECLGSFLFVFLSCGAAAQQPHPLGAALAPGLAALALVFCFAEVSGAHLSPAVTLALAATRRVSPLRALMFVTAQCGGAIAGAALLYGVSSNPVPLQMLAPAGAEPWQLFGLEAVLSFPVALCYFVARGSSILAPAVAAAYLASSLAAMPTLNPARALGPAFVLHKWDSHWVFWFGPLLGAVLAGTLYEFILNPRRGADSGKASSYGDASSVASDPDNYEDMDKGYNSLRGQQPCSPVSPNGGFCGAQSIKNEPIYSPRSLYNATSPPLTRANLNRSQSVYAKTPPASLLTRAQPALQPAHSLYPGLQVCRTYTAPRPFMRPEPIYGGRQQQPSPAEESAYGSAATYKKREYHNY